MSIHKRICFLPPLMCCPPAFSQSPAHVEMAKVESHSSARTVPLTAELAPFLQTDIEARSPGYVEKVLVDRGSPVHRGQLLVQLSAPEINSQTLASEANLHQAEADVAQAEAQAAAAESTAAKLQEAAKTPGAVAGNELLQAEKQRDAAQALVDSRKAAVRTAKDRLQASQATESYLRVTAPFDGMITDRFVNPGMLIDGGHTPMLKLQQVTHLRLIVPVPETYTASVVKGMSVVFHVPAHPGKSYTAKVARVPNALDQQSRSMMVELDVYNKDGSLAPGMYPTVDWPVGAGENLLFVPTTSVVTTTERAFVIASVNGRAHWIDVRKGPTAGENVSIRGQIAVGQEVVKRASDEIREGTSLR
ncbi:efflux RND transporter periplasmic adaptor subunit [Tunturibacter psychrotolerans]|uniref:Efflux RND transporter periplasmic adaptor subunit n=1 Tax=Tunturiibacter psychrotolerans TaxID=3069686 RepID=A0AAU7ZJP5_9BACT